MLPSQLDPDSFSACGVDPGIVCETVFDLTGSETTADLAELVSIPIRILLLALFAWIGLRILRKLISRTTDGIVRLREEAVREIRRRPHSMDLEVERVKAMELAAAEQAAARAAQRARTLAAVLRSVAALFVGALVVAFALGELGVQLGPLIAGAGFAGAALGFGAQSLVADYLSGLFMLSEDQYGVGDIVDLGDATGVVEDVQLRITKIRSVDGTLWYVRNGEITRVANHSQLWARAVVDVEVAYDTDLDLAGEVIIEVARQLWRDRLDDARIQAEPELWGVEALGASSIAVRVVMRTDPGQQWNVSRAFNKRVKQALDDAGIEIPFPQQVVWHRTEAPDAAVPPATGEAPTS